MVKQKIIATTIEFWTFLWHSTQHELALGYSLVQHDLSTPQILFWQTMDNQVHYKTIQK